MGYADRDYHRAGPPRPVSRFADIPVVKWLLLSNIGIFLIVALMLPNSEVVTPLEIYGVYSIDTALEGFQLWRLISFQFLHGGFFHLLFNMWALWIFGPFMERAWRSKAFLVFYLLCGVGGALFYTVLVFMPGVLPEGLVGDHLLGASAGIFGILVGVAVLAPNAQIRLLFPPIPMSLKTFALVFIGLEVFLLLTNSSNAGGSAGHLGGALVGVLLLKVPMLRGMLVSVAKPGGGPKAKPVKRARPESKLRPRSALVAAEATEMDRILDKINKEGLQSLTDGEREFLKKVSRK